MKKLSKTDLKKIAKAREDCKDMSQCEQAQIQLCLDDNRFVYLFDFSREKYTGKYPNDPNGPKKK